MTALLLLARALRVSALTVAYGLAFLPAGAARRPRLLRRYFEAGGGGLVKVGQVLAARYDLLPDRYCDELGGLLDDLRPVPAAAVRRVVRRSLGRPVDELYASFDPEPLATASLAQVHAAVLPGGAQVVVKVLKPDVRRTFRVDAAVLRWAGRVLDALPVLRGMDVRGVVDELARTALAELDLRREARNTAHLHRLTAADRVAHYVPAVHRDLCGADVLTLERIHGVSVRRLLAALASGDSATLDELARRGIEPERTAVVLVRSVLEQMIRFRVFNADPHPSNLIVMDGGTLAWVDFGFTGWLDDRQWMLQVRLRESFVDGNPHAAYLAMLDSLGPLPQNRDLRAFEQDMKESLRDYILATGDPDAPLTERSAGVFLMRVLQALRRSRLPTAPGTVAAYRTILIADMVVLRLYPSIDWVGHLRRFLHDYAPVALHEALARQRSAYTALQLAAAPAAAARTVDWLTTRLPELGRETLRTLTLFERLTLTVLRALRAAAVVVAVVLVWAAATGRAGWPVAGPWLAGCVVVFLLLNTMVRKSESS